MTFRKVRFDKTHDIAVLVALVASVDPDLATELKSADELTKYAVRIRYPEEAGDKLFVDKKLAQHSIMLAEKLYDRLSKVLGHDSNT